MKRRARLRLRGVSVLDGALRGLDPVVGRGDLLDEVARVDAGDVLDVRIAVKAGAPHGITDGLERMAEVSRIGVGSSRELSTAAHVTHGAPTDPDHGRELRALRTARARRLAIALGLAHGDRLE